MGKQVLAISILKIKSSNEMYKPKETLLSYLPIKFSNKSYKE